MVQALVLLVLLVLAFGQSGDSGYLVPPLQSQYYCIRRPICAVNGVGITVQTIIVICILSHFSVSSPSNAVQGPP